MSPVTSCGVCLVKTSQSPCPPDPHPQAMGFCRFSHRKLALASPPFEPGMWPILINRMLWNAAKLRPEGPGSFPPWIDYWVPGGHVERRRHMARERAPWREWATWRQSRPCGQRAQLMATVKPQLLEWSWSGPPGHLSHPSQHRVVQGSATHRIMREKRQRTALLRCAVSGWDAANHSPVLFLHATWDSAVFMCSVVDTSL